MRSESLSNCPFCGQPLVKAEAIAHLRRATRAYEQDLRASIESQVQQRHKRELETIRFEESQRSRSDFLRITRDLREATTKLNNLKLRHKRDLEDVRRTEAAAFKRELETSRKSIKAEITEQMEQKVSSRQRELTATIRRLEDQNAELSRRLEHLSSADRGGFNEEDIVRLISQSFPEDKVTRVGKGRKGGDIIQEVHYGAGAERVRAGTVVYECKDTKTWQNAFLRQAQDAGETHKTRHVILVTKAFPKNQKDLFWHKGIAVVHPARLVYLAQVIREMVIEVHRARLTKVALSHKLERLHEYLASEEFRQALENIARTGQQLKAELSDERAGHERTWKKREEAYNAIAKRVTGIDATIRLIVEQPMTSGQEARVFRMPRVQVR